MHLVGFMKRTCHNARSHERKKKTFHCLLSLYFLVLSYLVSMRMNDKEIIPSII